MFLPVLSVVIVLSACWSSVVLAAGGKKKAHYKLIFADEFNLPDGSSPDTAVWRVRDRAGDLSARWVSKSRRVAYIQDGNLVCRAIPNYYEPEDTATMLTGAIDTKGKFAVKYGRVEVRMKTNVKKGNFPAAWMRPLDNGRPYSYAEIDIFESFGRDSVARQTVHSQRSFMKKNVPQWKFITKTDVTKWHVYAVEWDARQLKFYVDGKLSGLYEKLPLQDTVNEGQWNFDRAFFLILNQSVSGNGWNDPDVNATYETRFDWIRVYKRK